MVALVNLLRFKWTWLIIGAVLIALGANFYLTAHPAAPVEVDGTIASYTEYTKNGAYDHNELLLAGDSNTYMLDKTGFHPALPDAVYKDGKVNIWIDQGSTTVLAMTLYDENDQNPTKYTTNHYDNPSSERSDAQAFGIVAGVMGAIPVGIFGVMFLVGRRRRPAAAPAFAGTALPLQAAGSPAAAGTSVGVSSDGKWYWDGAVWRPISADGNWRWDGTKWVELGVVYSARGAPPPPPSA